MHGEQGTHANSCRALPVEASGAEPMLGRGVALPVDEPEAVEISEIRKRRIDA